MEYYVKEIQSDNSTQKTAGVKARDDLESIFENNNIKKLMIPSCQKKRENLNSFHKLWWHYKVKNIWEDRTRILKQNDLLYIQFPVIEHTMFISSIIKNLVKRGVIIVLFLHDLEILRDGKRKDISIFSRIRNYVEETRSIRCSSYIVSHNKKMTKWIVEFGVPQNKIIELGIFDYLVPNTDEIEGHATARFRKDKPIIIAGNLRLHKAKYVYDLPDNYNYNLYGVDYSGVQNDKVRYFGSFSPEDLPLTISGSFGLVWDGVSSASCEGVYGKYLKINNPHKTSLYLAGGVPIIIWREAALASFITKYNVGFLIDSLEEIPKCIDMLSDEDYNNMKNNVQVISARLRNGYYTTRVIERVRNQIL